MNTTAKKQNKILLAALILILAAAAILVAITGSANKKAKETESEKLPAEEQVIPDESQRNAADTKKETKKDQSSSIVEELIPKKPTEDEKKKNATGDKAAEQDKASDNAPDKKPESAKDTETAAMQSGVLPKFTAPVDNFVTCGYSMDVPVFSYTMADYRTHNGVDIACSVGTPVTAAADGVVCEVANDPMMGVSVSVEHTGGAVTKYRGLSADTMDFISVGTDVKSGQVIGASGDTALIESAEEPHVHFELMIDGEHKDPGDYIKLRSISDVHED